jgi:hypothetical protein
VPNWGAIINIPMEIVKRRASPNLEDAEEAIYANGRIQIRLKNKFGYNIYIFYAPTVFRFQARQDAGGENLQPTAR